jgi:hypothetical protein
MKSILSFTTVVILFSSCFLFKDYRKKEFVYERNGQQVSVPIIVPKGYTKQEKIDTAGITLYSFQYSDSAYMYAAYLTDTAYQLQQFNKTIHQPLFHRLGGLVYKGQDEKELFYREIQQGNLRFGYRNVPLHLEALFDSATNYASLQKR